MRILLVDDTPADRLLVSVEIKSMCETANIDTADSVNEARRLLMAHKYDVMLLDVRLGLDDGLVFLNELRNSEHELYKNQRVYMMSGGTDALDKMAGVVLDVSYIEKSNSLLELREKLATILKELKDNGIGERKA